MPTPYLIKVSPPAEGGLLPCSLRALRRIVRGCPPMAPAGGLPARSGPSAHSACGQRRAVCGRRGGPKFFLRTPGGRRRHWQHGCHGIIVRYCPQDCPQPAHNVGGVSTQAVHRPVHRAIGRFPQPPEDCRNHALKLMSKAGHWSAFRCSPRGGGLHECRRTRPPGRRVRAHPAA